MGYILKKVGSSSNAPIVEYYCDTELDLNDLPTNVPMGSLAHIINNGRVFVLNSEGNWVKQTLEAFIQMSSNDYTDEDKEKVDAIPDDPQYTDTNTTYELATEEDDGLMAALDKVQVNKIPIMLIRLEELEASQVQEIPKYYVLNEEDWEEQTEVLYEEELISASEYLNNFGLIGDTIITYEGTDKYIIIPNELLEEGVILTLNSLKNLEGEEESVYPVGIAGKVNELVKLFILPVNNIYYNFSHLDVLNVTNAKKMFAGQTELTGLNMSSWDTSNFETTEEMFSSCFKIANLDLNSWDVSNLLNTKKMFDNCINLSNLNMSEWTTDVLENAEGMFVNCSSLINLDLSNWNTSNLDNVSFMFGNCSNLKTLNLSSWDTTNITNVSNVFTNCELLEVIYFKTEEDADKLTSPETNIIEGVELFVDGELYKIVEYVEEPDPDPEP